MKLADYIEAHRLQSWDRSGFVLELGAATGALAMFLSTPPRSFQVITSDIDDGGDVEANISHNFKLNDLESVMHMPYTWGNDLVASLKQLNDKYKTDVTFPQFKYIVASDILLYVSAYPALVESLVKLFELSGHVEEFLMAWNRRIDESKIFYALMDEAGFLCDRLGGGIYSFTRR